MSEILSAESSLTALFNERVPGGRLALQSPPGLAIQLWLADPAMFSRRFDDQQVNAIMQAPPYWSFCWASGQVLANWILAQPSMVAGKRVVDLGSGSGVVAIAAALAGAQQVYACDLDPQARTAAVCNGRINGVVLTPVEQLSDIDNQVDVLLAADILYDQDNFALLSAIRATAPTIWLADSRVKDFQAPGFEWQARGSAVSFPDMGEWEGFNQVNVYRALRADR